MGAVALLALLAAVSGAQATHSLVGRVVDDAGQPLGDAAITVVGTLWQARTQPDGRFHFRLSEGQWELYVRRIGYQPESRTVLIAADEPTDTLRITLASTAAELHGVVVTGEAEAPTATTITRATVRNAPPLGEADIFRILPLLPGISQPNDLIGRLHIAGGASDENAVYLDGHPVQSPFHVLSVLGAFNVASLDRADVLIHHLPSAIDGRVSGAIDLVSRQPKSRPAREIDVSLLSATLTATQPSLFHGVGALASGRVTYLDRIVGGYARHTGASDDVSVPSFRDGIAALSRHWQSGWSAQLLGYGTSDSWSGAEGPRLIPPQWGEGLLGVRVDYDDIRWHAGLRVSTDRATVRFERPNDVATPTGTEERVDFIDVRQRWTSMAAELHRVGRRWSLAGGLTLDARDHVHRWAGNEVQDWFSPHMPLTYDARATQTLPGAFVETGYLGSAAWNATAGAHVTTFAGRTYLAPRFVAATQVSPRLRFQLAADRRHQFDAIAEEPEEGSITQPTFLLRTPRVADMLTLSATWRTPRTAAHRRIGTEVAVYARRDRDRTVLSPPESPTQSGTPSAAAPPLSADFPAFRRVPGRTVGASITADLELAGATLQASYTAQRVRERVDGRWRLTSWDVPQTFSLFAGVPLGRRWTLTSAAQFRDGTTLTPVAARIFVPIGVDQYVPRFIFGDENSARLPSYRRVDLGIRREWQAHGADWALSLQVLNVFARENALDRDWLSYFGCVARNLCSASGASRQGLPILPSLGLEVRW